MTEPEILDAQQPDTGQMNTRAAASLNAAERQVEAEVRAVVEARVLMAYKNPRNWHVVRSKIMDACGRVGFAEQALYRKPVGSKKEGDNWVKTYAEGASIRLAEEVVRAMGNTMSEQRILFEDATQRVVSFMLMDLEGNNTDSAIVVVPKQIERRTLKKGQVALSSRANSEGQTVYLVEATDDEVDVKVAAMIAKKRRDAIMRLCPSDIREDAVRKIKQTLQQRDKVNPKEALNRLLDAFQEKGIAPDQIIRFLGHELEIITPDELMALRGIFGALQDGEITWAQLLKEVEEDRDGALRKQAEAAEARKATKGAAGNAAGAPASAKKPSAAEQAMAGATAAGQSMAAGTPTGGTLDIPTD